jgi:hypothetical protein
MKKGKLWLFGIAAFVALSMVTGCLLEAPTDEEVLSGAQEVTARSVALLNDLPDSLDGTHWEGYGPMDPPSVGAKVTLDVDATGVDEDTGEELGTITFYFPHDNTHPPYAYTYNPNAASPGGTVTETPEGSGNPGAYTLVQDGSGNYSLVFDNFYGYHPDDVTFDLAP